MLHVSHPAYCVGMKTTGAPPSLTRVICLNRPLSPLGGAAEAPSSPIRVVCQNCPVGPLGGALERDVSYVKIKYTTHWSAELSNDSNSKYCTRSLLIKFIMLCN
jgi:hypothetical protein